MKIIDNFLEPEEYGKMKVILCGEYFPWHYNDYVNSREDEEGFQFIHFFYEDHKMWSNYYNDIVPPIVNKLNCKAIMRVKANLITRSHKKLIHGYHTDYDPPNKNKTAIMYFNTTNGATHFEDGSKVDCVDNRVVIFNSKLKHSSSTCTDQNQRVVLNINYYDK